MTDDEGVLDAQGYLHVLGRSDRIVNSGGEKIDPLEVETLLLESGYAKEVLVLGWPDVEWGEKLIAFYTPSNEQRQASGLNEWLRAHMVDYKRPKVMICVEALPVTANGKLEHDRIQALLEES
jgi:O-succinylbenzoic acid--CoA ligase